MIRCLCGHKLARVVAATDGDNLRAITFACDGCGHDIGLALRLSDLGRSNVRR